MTTGQRFKQVLEDIKITNNGFAMKIGVSSTVINGIVNDQNKPGNKVLTAMKEVYPNYNTDWILTGQGAMKNPDEKPSNYLHEHLLRLEESFMRLSQQIEVKDQQIAAKDKQIERLMDLLGKPSDVIGEAKVMPLWKKVEIRQIV